MESPEMKSGDMGVEGMLDPLAALVVVAQVASVALSLSSIPTMRAIMNEGTTARRPLLPFSAQAMSGLTWMLYGWIVFLPEYVVTGAVSFLSGICYFVCFAAHAPSEANWLPGRLYQHALLSLVISVYMFHVSNSTPADEAAELLGRIGTTVSIVMFSGPLCSVFTVVKTKSTASLAFSLTVATSINCVLWITQGLIIDDFFVWFPNTLGLVAALLQLALFAVYGRAESGPMLRTVKSMSGEKGEI